MDTLISVGKGEPIPGREEILAGKQEGWDIFCAFCVEFLTAMLNRYHYFKWDETPTQIALGVTTKVFLAFKKRPETLANMRTAEEIMRYLRRCAWVYRKAAAIVELMLASKPMTAEEGEELGAESDNRNPEILGLASLDPEHATAARELVVLVERARRRMSLQKGEVLDRAIWGDSHEMIAQALGINEKAVGQELNRARQDLLKHMPEDSISALEMFVPEQLRKLRGSKQRSKRVGTFEVSAHG